MTALNFTAQSLGDAAAGKPVLPGLEPDTYTQCGDLTIAVLEGGTTAGTSSVSLIFKDPATGHHYVAETTAALFLAGVGAVRGAVERFGK